MTRIKILTIAFLIFIFNVKAFALDANYKNSLKEIDVQKSSQKGYLINLIFEKPYQEPLALKKKTPGEYIILLPETKLASDNVNVLYEAAKGLITFDIAQNSYVDESIDNGYVKIKVSTKSTIPIGVTSGVAIKTKVEKIKKEDIQIIVPNVEKDKTSKNGVATEPQTLEEDIAENPISGSIPVLQTQNTASLVQKTTITQKIKNKIKKVVIKITRYKKSLTFKKLLKLGMIGFILLAVLNQMIKVKNSAKKSKQSKFAAQNGVLKRETASKSKVEPEDLTLSDDDSQSSYPRSTFGKMSQRNSYQSSTPENTLKRISAPQNIAQINDSKESLQQDYVIKNQSNPFVTSSIEKNGQTIAQTPAKIKENQAPEEEIVEEAPNPDYPELVSQVRISKNKGLYLVNYDDQYSLLGYINDKIFVIKKFESINNRKLQVRVNAKTEKSTTYIVRLDNYKALLDVSASNMKTLIEF